MNNIPMFTTEYGVADLILKEIPYRQTAYILVRCAQAEDLQPLIDECKAFCRMAGAEHIYACGHEGLDRAPLYTAVLECRGMAWTDPEKLASLFPVTEQTVSRWRSIYNERMRDVDNSATLETRDEKKLLNNPGAYFVHQDGELLGIGWLEDTKLLAMAAVKPGAGERVMHSLMSLIEGSTMTLEVASTNQKALALYRRLGLLPVGEISRWYDVGGKVL